MKLNAEYHASAMTRRLDIHPACLEDVPRLLELGRALFAIETDFSFDADKFAEGLELLMSRPDRALVLVAKLEGEVVGMCQAQVLVSTAEGGEVGLVEDVVVHERFRGRGIGHALLERLESWARSRDLKRLQLLADQHNRGALHFYDRQGWSATNLTARKKKLRNKRTRPNVNEQVRA